MYAADMEEAKIVLKIILNDDVEFERLTSIFNAKYNTYNYDTEIFIYKKLAVIVSKGIKTQDIKDIPTLNFLAMLVFASNFQKEDKDETL